jgi:hypothetical protein
MQIDIQKSFFFNYYIAIIKNSDMRTYLNRKNLNYDDYNSSLFEDKEKCKDYSVEYMIKKMI